MKGITEKSVNYNVTLDETKDITNIIDINEVKHFLRVNNNDDDKMINSFIMNAIDMAEIIINQHIKLRNIICIIDSNFINPINLANFKNEKNIEFFDKKILVKLKYVPILSFNKIEKIIEKINYSNEQEDNKELQKEVIEISLDEKNNIENTGKIYLDIKDDHNKYIKYNIEYTSGYNKDNLPSVIKNGIFMHVASMYDYNDFTISSKIRSMYLSYQNIKL